MKSQKIELAGEATRVYSYSRFSTPEQKKGDSERRQHEAAKAWANKNGFVLDENFRLSDEGLSGYHGTHRKKGALGAFLAKVEAGEVAKGSILLVENIDRLSREGVAETLQKIVFKLWDHEITLVTLMPEEWYPPGSGSETKFLVLLLYMSRAHEESKRKSERLCAARSTARKRAREEGRPMTRMCPAWLEVRPDRTGFDVIEPAVETINLIYRLKDAGLGNGTIVLRLNQTAPWSPKANPRRKGSGWRASYVKRLLANPAVIGIYQPHRKIDGKRVPAGEPIVNYYPPIIPEPLYHAVQEKLNANRGRGGRTGVVTNLFTHLVRCAYCGGPMTLQNKGKPPKGATYLVCDNGYRGMSCKRHRIRYDEFEETVLANCDYLRPEQVLPKPSEFACKCLALKQRIQGAAGEIAKLEQQANTLIDRIAATSDRAIGDRYEAKLMQVEIRKTELIEHAASEAKELESLEKSAATFRDWVASLSKLKAGLATGEVDLRLRLRAHLREIIRRIDIFPVGHEAIYDADRPQTKQGGLGYRPPLRTGDDIAQRIIEQSFDSKSSIYTDPRFDDFIRYVESLRMSKAGRFFRVHYVTGATVDLVPQGSIADGMCYVCSQDQWLFVRPNIDHLWRQYCREPRNRQLS